ncbi:hypothetical protein CP49_37950 [Bradyrhizobium valentinum]|uniref:Uncharacterized protein n=1 Tax=Bradyrhizobium valentinum TaxID=1518501 RepID=A0A0R3KX82_9BRAD|nr:hypothetical protein [Bradyrhizobium valentinum]KRQ97509.1 hypothetical protein CP49_37950 [Bradyrhizobium valentinum]
MSISARSRFAVVLHSTGVPIAYVKRLSENRETILEQFPSGLEPSAERSTWNGAASVIWL